MTTPPPTLLLTRGDLARLIQPEPLARALRAGFARRLARLPGSPSGRHRRPPDFLSDTTARAGLPGERP